MKRYIILLAAALATMSINAQSQKEDLHKEITLDKDFVPVEKKATKKNTLPRVAKPKTTSNHTTLNYSDRVEPGKVTTDIPTLLPYGYRTAHLFSDKRGYLDVGGGSQANFTGAFGYRIIDEDESHLNLWLQHNSTWNGRNSSLQVPDFSERFKQQINDNVLGLNYEGKVGPGTLKLGALGHLDTYNYYGGWQGAPFEDNEYLAREDWGSFKQTYHHLGLNAGWQSSLSLSDHEVNYNAGLQYGHSGYSNALDNRYSHGVQEHALRLDLGGSYQLANGSVAGLDFTGEYLKHDYQAKGDAWNPNDNCGMITLSPYYSYDNDRFHLQAGVNVHLSFSDGATLRLSPNVKFDMGLARGVTLFASAQGGKALGYMDPVHTNFRYSAPQSFYSSVYTPVDAKVGLAIGPFQGFSARVMAGYAVVKGALDPCISPSYQLPNSTSSELESFSPPTLELMMIDKGGATYFVPHDVHGYFVGAELNYKYRSLVDAKFSIKYAPQDDTFDTESYTTGYDLGAHCGNIVMSAGVDVTPIKPLTLNIGFDYVGDRGVAKGGYEFQRIILPGADRDTEWVTPTATGKYEWLDMNDIVDLKLGATYRFDKSLAVWAQAHNLLNKRWDLFYGMGTQRIGIMAGVQVTF